MSGKPSPDGVKEIIVALDTIRALRQEIADLAPKVARYEKAHEELGGVYRDYQNKLRAMDVDPPTRGTGVNYGHYDRLGWMLEEMYRNVNAKLTVEVEKLRAPGRISGDPHIPKCGLVSTHTGPCDTDPDWGDGE